MTMRVLLLLAGLLLSATATSQAPGCDGADEALFEQARSAHRLGRFEEALDASTRLSACFPENVDFQFQRALALAALGQNEAALSAAREAVALAPDYADVLALVERLEARIAREEERLAAEAAAQAEAEAAAAATEAAREPEPAAPARWAATAFASAHQLSGGRDGWTDAAIDLRRTSADGTTIGGGIGYERRGNVTDVSVSADALYPVAAGTRLTGRVGMTPGNAFRPGVLVAAGAEHDLPGGWVTRGALVQRRFEGDRADSATVGADYYVGAFRLAGALTLSRLASAGSALGTVVTVDWYATDTHRFRVTASVGDELDTIDEGSTVIESRVRALTFSGEHALSQRLSLGWWIGTVEQGTFYDRRNAGLAVTRRY